MYISNDVIRLIAASSYESDNPLFATPRNGARRCMKHGARTTLLQRYNIHAVKPEINGKFMVSFWDIICYGRGS